MPATIIIREKKYEVKHGSTVRIALQRISIEPDAVLATRDGELITDDEIVQDGDVIKLVSVISGG
jgi:sulfur carrier protein ThiS